MRYISAADLFSFRQFSVAQVGGEVVRPNLRSSSDIKVYRGEPSHDSTTIIVSGEIPVLPSGLLISPEGDNNYICISKTWDFYQREWMGAMRKPQGSHLSSFSDTIAWILMYPDLLRLDRVDCDMGEAESALAFFSHRGATHLFPELSSDASLSVVDALVGVSVF